MSLKRYYWNFWYNPAWDFIKFTKLFSEPKQWFEYAKNGWSCENSTEGEISIAQGFSLLGCETTLVSILKKQ